MYNFLCVGGDKYGCNLFTEGSNGKIVSVDEALESDPSIPLCWSGSYKKSLFDHCIDSSRKFYNLDKDHKVVFLGNPKSYGNRFEQKLFKDCFNSVTPLGNLFLLFARTRVGFRSCSKPTAPC